MQAAKKDGGGRGRGAKRDETKQYKADPPSSPTRAVAPVPEQSAVLAELRKFRQEQAEASADTRTTLTGLETTINDVLKRTKLEQQTASVERRLGDTEDRGTR